MAELFLDCDGVLADFDTGAKKVLGGLSPGEVYVTDNAFLIRADIEKSGASHDH